MTDRDTWTADQDGANLLWEAPYRFTWFDRLRFRLLPTLACELPEAPGTWKGCVIVRTIVGLDWRDRLRVLLTGRLLVETRTVTEHEPGACVTASTAYPTLKKDPRL